MTPQADIHQITSKQNTWYKELRDWTHSSGHHKSKNHIWLEGDHLCEAARLKGFLFETLVFSEDCPMDLLLTWSGVSAKMVQVSTLLMKGLSSLQSAPMLAAVVVLPDTAVFDPAISAVVLDQMQDPGNAGSILRSAAAFGFKQCVTTPHTVGLWTHKVVRSAMGAHFALNIVENVSIDDIQSESCSLNVVLTSSHMGSFLDDLIVNRSLPMPIAWVFGHEGKGHSPSWSALACQTVRIRQPGGQESLNVAAAAAICLHASSTQLK